MPSPKRRAKLRSGALSESEFMHLRFGGSWFDGAGGFSFAHRDGSGTWVVDEVAARAAWEAHRDEIWDQTDPPFIPWAARKWDGAAGEIDPYEHLYAGAD